MADASASKKIARFGDALEEWEIKLMDPASETC